MYGVMYVMMYGERDGGIHITLTVPGSDQYLSVNLSGTQKSHKALPKSLITGNHLRRLFIKESILPPLVWVIKIDFRWIKRLRTPSFANPSFHLVVFFMARISQYC